MAALMGIDVGTSSAKAELVDEDGATWSASSSPYGMDSPRPGWAEQRPEVWWEAVQEAVGRVWDRAGRPAGTEVTVGFTGQMHSTVLVDGGGTPLRPSVLWCDSRAVAEAREIVEQVPNVAQVTGNVPLPAFTVAHLLWLRRHEPRTFAEASSVVLPKDYIRSRVTGELGTDRTDASGTGMLDISSQTWSAEVLDGVGMRRDLLPIVRRSHELVGEVRGLLPDGVRARAVVGLGDQFAEALSAGLVDAGPLVIVLGTSGVLLRSQDRPGLGVFSHAPDDRWLRLESLHAGGLSLAWFRATFAPDRTYDELLAEAASIPPGADGLLFLPFLVAERSGDGSTPRGSFLGARPVHTRAHFARAVLEGVAFELRRIATGRMGIGRAEGIVLKGGGARSRLWAQVIADVFGSPVGVTARTAASGAADVAGVAAGWWTYAEAAGRSAQDPIEPVPSSAAGYETRFPEYVATVDALSDRGARRG